MGGLGHILDMLSVCRKHSAARAPALKDTRLVERLGEGLSQAENTE
jgi:hypothetical protein